MLNATIAPQVPDSFPKPFVVKIGTVLSGEIKPSLNATSKYRWHSSCSPTTKVPYMLWLIQGHGDTPEMALAESIICERKLMVERLEVMNLIERELGTLGKTDDEVRAMAAAKPQGGGA